MMTITELPPFTPQLIDFRHGEFHRQSLELLPFPIEHDQHALDIAPFQIDPPTPPPDPRLPLLPHVWYPQPIKAVRDWAMTRLMPARPPYFIGKVRSSQANDLMRPLLAGEGPVMVQGDVGMGKTSLMAFIATQDRTTRRYRRVYWIDSPDKVVQSLALALNEPHALSLKTLSEQIEFLAAALDDTTLVVIDNVLPEQAASFRPLTRHLMMGVEMMAVIVDEEDPQPDPEGVVTLRPLPRTDAIELMAHACGISDVRQLRGQMRAWLTQLIKLLGGHPLAITVTGALFREDGLPMEQLVDMLDKRIKPEDPRPLLAVEMSLDALPGDYTNLLTSLAALPMTGSSLEAILAVSDIRQQLTAYRGLSFLTKHGFIQRREGRYVAHPIIWEKFNKPDLHNADNPYGERLRRWVLSSARRNSEAAEEIYRDQDEILHALTMAQRAHQDDFVHKLNMTLGSYFREYAPAYLADDIPTPRLMGKRADVAKLSREALDYLRTGNMDAAEEAGVQALELAEEHSSDHEIAETLVISASIADVKEQYRKATRQMERAAKIAFDLDNQESLHILRLGLAMLYRKQERYKDALGVLDDSPDTYAERARIYRASEQWEEMIEALAVAGDLTPKERAESLILAGKYADALEALAEGHSSGTAILRAYIYHLQDDLNNAIRGYQLAIDTLSERAADAQEARLSMGIAYAASGDYQTAEKHFQEVLDLQNQQQAPDYLLKGKALALLAALNLVNQNPNEAIRLGERSLEALQHEEARSTHRVRADVFRTIGRAQWRLGRVKQALAAFEGEVDQAQSVRYRDEQRIGIALHHLADALRADEELDRTIANYRRALTHKDSDENHYSFFITQLALHRALFEAERFEDALETSQRMLKHLDARPPADLQHLGYALCQHALTLNELGLQADAHRAIGRWMSVLAGRSDALRDEERPMLGLLALNLAVRSLLASNRSDEALPLAEQALSLAEKHYPGTDIAWSARRDLGEVHSALEYWKNAIDTFGLLFHKDNRVDDDTYAFAQAQTAICYWQLDDLDKALEHFQEGLERQADSHKQALLLEQMAELHLQKRDTATAITTIKRAAELLDPEVYTGDAARIHTKLAQLYAGSNRFTEAVQVYEDALSMLRSLPDVEPIHMAQVYTTLAESNEAQGQYPQASISYRNALDILEANPAITTDLHRRVLVKLAEVKVIMQDHDSAIVLYQQARDETEHYGTEIELGLVTASLADLHRDTGQFDDALYYYEQALELQPAAEVPRDRAGTLRGYGRTLAQVEQFEDARSAWNQALAITTDAPPLEIALTYRAIGQAYRAQNMFEEAEEAFQDALKYHESLTEHIAETLRLYSSTLIEAKRFEEAIKPLLNALDIEEGLPQQVNVRIVQTLELIAYAYEQCGNIGEAIASYHKAMVYMDRTHQPVQIATRLRTLGRLYTIQERWSEAHKALEDALEIEFGYQPRSDSRIAGTLEMIAVAYRKEGQLEKAADAYKRMASYANLSKNASEDLQTTLSELETLQQTLDTARSSLAVLERTGGHLHDLIFVYALVAETEAKLFNVNASNDAIDSLLTSIEKHANQLTIADPRPDYRAFAHIFEGSQSASAGNLSEARAHFQRALHDTSNKSLRWVIERGLESVQG